MRSFTTVVAASCALHDGYAFKTTPPSSRLSSAIPLIHRRMTSLPFSVTVGSNDKLKTAQRTLTIIEQREMETIRLELVQKYIALGHTSEYATREVSYFLDDDERSKQYVEMRRVAMKRGNDFGIEDYIQFGAAFVVGWVGSFVLNSWHELQVRRLCLSSIYLMILFITIFASLNLLNFYTLCDSTGL